MQTPRNFVPCQVADWYELPAAKSLDAPSVARVDDGQSDSTAKRTEEFETEGGRR